MKLVKPLAIAVAIAALHGAASAATYGAVTGTGFTTETTSVFNQYLAPMPPAGSTVTSYSVLSTMSGFSTTGTISFAPTTSYSFLWGSPDSFNSVSDGTKTVTGSMVSSGTGNNLESLVYTFTDVLPFSSLVFTTSGIAFEIATVTPVPEPETYALLLGGLGAVFTIARRRKS